MRPYVVHQGEHLDRIAFIHGFTPSEIWHHKTNEELRTRRQTPDQLYPGDVIYIPAGSPEGLSIRAGTENRFTAYIPTIPVNLVFESKEVLEHEPCEIRGLPGTSDESPLSRQTGPKGKLELNIPVLVREVEVFFPRINIVYQVRVGHMDPETELAGIKKRLRNLGYLSMKTNLRDDDALVPGAIRTFQVAQGLHPSGQIDDATRQRLVAEHEGGAK